MTDIKQVSDWALTVAAEAAGSKLHHYERMADDNRLAQSIEAHARTIEWLEAFRQEVSDALEKRGFYIDDRDLGRFIIAKPDPLVEAVKACNYATLDAIEPEFAKDLRAALEARGGKIVWEAGE